ncbi:amino-acid N-acetyltransferas-like protein subunit Mak10 [Karstenula rhodostoma CBS 690.94]|uniref:Amino-acid N-acetyltransferas-like protein subunit Mak10 n=1 Tax=Karstenula rhodostoma CBS 690.94 TaxID=1392251 RepID=A0A9P4UBW9_9PLEO|nr:amino-acid N-acetyltransferas-like protein subunit Mak10 [Karstenula rhodostoma CBS 690.94]
MADPSLLHRDATARETDALTASNGTGPAFASAESSRFAQTSLPLRQAPRRGAPPQIHDVTEKFTRACQALDVGQLVKDEYFTLFESIGAIEIMDPKMDSGFLQPGETLEDDFDPLAPLLPEELIGIMDQLLGYEMAWHTGYPLSQTLFTSVYIDRLLWPESKTIPQAQFYRGDIPVDKRPGTLLDVLRAYCLALIKGCDYVIAKIMARDYFEEEDFATHTYNRVLFVQAPIDVFLRELDASMEMIEDPDLEIDDGIRSAIIARLQFRKSFLCALDPECPLEILSDFWPPVLPYIDQVNNTHTLGKSVPGSFSTKIQRRLASTVPPRPIVQVEFKDALQTLKQLCTDCEEATRFKDLPTDPLEYQSFLWTFASRQPAPLTYSRSYLSNILFDPYILNAPVSLPLEDVKSFVFHESPILDPSNWALSPPRNPLMPKPPRLQFALLIDEFVERVGQPYLDLWVALGQNRCRLRRMLAHVIIAWDMLQQDAVFVDADLVAYAFQLNISEEVMDGPLQTWVYIKKLWMIEKVIILGFEQDIYLPDEHAGMYYFLSLMANKRKDALLRCVQHNNDRTVQFLRSSHFEDAQSTSEKLSFIDSEFQQATGISAFAKALHGFYTIANYLHLLPSPKRPFSTEDLRYELRMKPFLSLQPSEVPPFEEFQAALQPYGSYCDPSPSLYEDFKQVDSKLWSDIGASLKAAKDAFAKVKKYGAKESNAGGVEQAWNKETQGMLASCIALGVAVAGLKSAVKDIEPSSGVQVKVEIPPAGADKRYVEGWIVPKILKG